VKKRKDFSKERFTASRGAEAATDSYNNGVGKGKVERKTAPSGEQGTK